MEIVDRIRLFEEKKATLFSVKKPFSEHLMKWEDANDFHPKSGRFG